MIGHLGPRVSDLLDGQMTAQQEERAWNHVHGCDLCRQQVEREGWVKTQLSALSGGAAAGEEVPSNLKGALRGAPAGTPGAAGTGPVAMAGTGPPGSAERSGRRRGVAVVGGTAVGACVLGVLALGAVPAYAPVPDRRAPVNDLTGVTPEPTPSPLRTQSPASGSEDDGGGVGPVSVRPVSPPAVTVSPEPESASLPPWGHDEQRQVKIGP